MYLLDLKPNFENKIRLALYTKSVKKEMEQKLEFVMQMGQRI